MKRAFARGRVFPQSYSTDRRYGRLSLKACALFPLIWVNADDQGRLCGDPEEVKYACCPNIDHITKADVPPILSELEHNQLIKIYDTPRGPAIQMLDWWNIQKPQWAWPSEYPPPEGWRDRLRYKKGAKTVITANWPSAESREDSQVKEEKASGDVESNSQVETEKRASGESVKPPQPNQEVISGEVVSAAHTVVNQVSPEPTPQAQAKVVIPQARREVILAGVSPYPSPDLSSSLETENETETEIETERGNRNRNSPEDSGESPNGSQVRTISQSDEKPPDFLVEGRKQVFEGLTARRGYNSPQAGAEAKAITWMLQQGYLAPQILNAYDRLKQDEFWRDKLLNMQSVKAQIGEIYRGRRSHEQRESPTGERGQPGRYAWEETPDGPGDTS
ncbi:MAG: hypothetical protein PHQ43_03980 [Dehalococcoidales bacterium]|nr:hypothetical protein [Dehalococcoidales bacterium]